MRPAVVLVVLSVLLWWCWPCWWSLAPCLCRAAGRGRVGGGAHAPVAVLVAATVRRGAGRVLWRWWVVGGGSAGAVWGAVCLALPVRCGAAMRLWCALCRLCSLYHIHQCIASYTNDH